MRSVAASRVRRSHSEDNGSWSKPENLGPDVNSFYDDKFPTLSVDGKTMYFASQGFNSMGGFDIFKTTFDDNTETWSEPVNLGPPINTPDDEISFSLAGNGRDAYMAIARDEGMGERDLYKLTFEDESVSKFMTVIKGKVIVTTNPKASFEKVELKDKATAKVVCTFSTPAPNTAKEYLLAAPPGEYIIEVTSSNFKTYSEELTLGPATAETMIKDLTVDATPKSE